jgi:glycosyltransferase involved in cell wall biosynthesis
MDDVVVVIVNYKTLLLTRNCYESLRIYYPNVRVLLIDNGSHDESTEWIAKSSFGHTFSITWEENLGHGPALHHAATQTLDFGYMFALDSDCQVYRHGFLEDMRVLFDKDVNLYAAGEVKHVNERIQHVPKGYPYAHPSRMMFSMAKYRTLKPFVNHGGPTAKNMIDASKKGYSIASYPIQDYVFHLGEGTFREYNVPGRWVW